MRLFLFGNHQSRAIIRLAAGSKDRVHIGCTAIEEVACAGAVKLPVFGAAIFLLDGAERGLGFTGLQLCNTVWVLPGPEVAVTRPFLIGRDIFQHRLRGPALLVGQGLTQIPRQRKFGHQHFSVVQRAEYRFAPNIGAACPYLLHGRASVHVQ